MKWVVVVSGVAPAAAAVAAVAAPAPAPLAVLVIGGNCVMSTQER